MLTQTERYVLDEDRGLWLAIRSTLLPPAGWSLTIIFTFLLSTTIVNYSQEWEVKGHSVVASYIEKYGKKSVEQKDTAATAIEEENEIEMTDHSGLDMKAMLDSDSDSDSDDDHKDASAKEEAP